MNKQELIEKLNELPVYGYDTTIIKREVLALVKQLDEPQKVVLPKDVAEWLERMSKVLNLYGVLDKFIDGCNDGDNVLYDYLIKHFEDSKEAYNNLARAYLDGYEVEKEKLYTVVLPNAHSIPFGCNCYLHRRDEGVVILAIGTFSVREDTKLTEAEIKSVDERYMAFAEEVAE